MDTSIDMINFRIEECKRYLDDMKNEVELKNGKLAKMTCDCIIADLNTVKLLIKQGALKE